MLQDPSVRAPIAIALGAIAGALSRYYLTLWFTKRLGDAFPYGTLFINLSGCLVMGFFTTIALERIQIPPDVRLLVTTGFLGAYTTFSTYGLDSIHLVHNQQITSAGLYWAGSTILGVACVQLGSVLARIGR